MAAEKVTARTIQPPGPGHNLTLGEIRGNPLEFLTEMSRRFGDIVQYGTGEWLAVLLNRPDYVQHVLQDNFRNYRKEGTPDLRILKPMLGDGLLTSDGASWEHQRQMLAPAFRQQHIKSFAELMTGEAQQTLDQWELYLETGKPLEVGYQMSQLTLRIVARALFNYDVSSESGLFGKAVEVLNESMGHVDPTDQNVWRRFQQALGTIHQVVERVIRERNLNDSGTIDALAMMLRARDQATGDRMSDLNVRDQTLTLLLAGHETTAKALTWTLYLLDQHPGVADRLRAEIAAAIGDRLPTVDDLDRLPYTWAVIQEAMRVYPPIWIISRIAISDDSIDGYHIPAGALVPLSPYLMHHHPDYWEEPDRFDPERFNPEKSSNRHPYAYLPFGDGPRHCVGQHFASLELQLVLAAIVQRYRLSLAPGHPVEAEALVTLRPRHGLWMTVHSP